MEEKKDLWELVRKKLEKNSIPESLEFVENESIQTAEIENIKNESTDNIYFQLLKIQILDEV